ncbi:unnamed protein product, partial [Ectocarpus sp. 4 AP-2014]
HEGQWTSCCPKTCSKIPLVKCQTVGGHCTPLFREQPRTPLFCKQPTTFRPMYRYYVDETCNRGQEISSCLSDLFCNFGVEPLRHSTIHNLVGPRSKVLFDL